MLVRAQRDQAGSFWGLIFGLNKHTSMIHTNLTRPWTNYNEHLLDLGTCPRQDPLPLVVYDRAPTAQLYGSDLSPAFED